MENKLLKNVLKGDKVIWSLFFGLLAFSMLAVYSSIGRSAIINSGSTPERAMLKHCVFIAISIFCAVVVSNTPYQLFRKLSLVVMLIGCAGLLYIIATHGERWIRIFGFSFQPSEFAKPALMVFLASMIDKHKDKLDSLQLFLQLLLIIFIVSGLNFKDDFSTTALYLMCSMMVLFYGKVNFKYWIRTILIVVVVAVALIIYSMNDYKHSVERSQLYTEAGVAVAQEESFGRIATIGHRMKDWLKPDTNDLNYQGNIAKMAVASGGLKINGPGSTIQARLMTQAESDMIYAIILEEYGIWGGLLVFILYTIIFLRCMKLSRRCNDTFAYLCCSGLCTLIYIQALVNMGVSLGFFPITGQTLPLISTGGSSMIMVGVTFGVIQSVSFNTHKAIKKENIKALKDAGFEELKEMANATK